MMRRYFSLTTILALLLLIASLFIFSIAFAQPKLQNNKPTDSNKNVISLNELVENSKFHDHQIVTISGEALLEGLERHDGVWINIHDGSNAIGLFMSQEDAKRIRYFGDYKNKGDFIIAKATFNRACPVHGGDLDLHLIEIINIQKGYPVARPVSPLRLLVAIIFLVTSLIMLRVYRNGRKINTH